MLLIDWPLLRSALHSCPHTYRMWASKFASCHTAVRQTMALWKQQDSPLCLFCHLAKETTQHIQKCPHPPCTIQWHQSVEELWSWLITADTCPAITHCLSTTLHACRVQPFSSFAGPACLEAASAQSQIGFFCSIMGCLSPPTEQAQAAFWLAKHSNYPISLLPTLQSFHS